MASVLPAPAMGQVGPDIFFHFFASTSLSFDIFNHYFTSLCSQGVASSDGIIKMEFGYIVFFPHRKEKKVGLLAPVSPKSAREYFELK